jgi:phosphonate transport system permease protein
MDNIALENTKIKRAPEPKEKIKPTDPDILRAQLLRPYPAISLRGLLILGAVVLVLAWSLSAVGPSPLNRIYSLFDPFIAMGNLLERMLPPELELARRSVTILGTTFVIDQWPVVVTSVFETIQMALIGTIGGVLMSLPISLLAAKNTSPHPVIYQVVRLILNLMRSIPELVYALLFVVAIGLGPFTGVFALAFGTIGSLSRIYAEAIEQIDPQQVMAVRATGATSPQTFIYAVFPQAFPLLISYSIIFFESNVRHATILGYVGAGGVGYKLFEYIGKSDYQMVMGTAVVLVVAVTVIDRFSSALRQRFI